MATVRRRGKEDSTAEKEGDEVTEKQEDDSTEKARHLILEVSREKSYILLRSIL